MINENNFSDYKDKITSQWLAGFFDGEGYVTAYLQGNGNVNMRVGITQKNKYVLMLIMLHFPGIFVTHKKVSPKGSHYTCYSIHWEGRKAVPFLKAIKDYVVVKHALVVVGLQLAEMFGEKNYKLDEDERQARSGLKAILNNLNADNKNVQVI